MKILLINPNTTVAMTEQVLNVARATFGNSITFEALTAKRGVGVIASRASYVIAAQSVLETWAAYRKPVDAIVVACFGDPGVAALRELTPIPVYGLAETTLREAGSKNKGFAIVTAGPQWKPMLDELAASWHIDGYCGTYAIDATGLGAAGNPQHFQALLQGAIDKAYAEGASTIVLGGAALTGTATMYQTPALLLDCVQVTLGAVLRQVNMPIATVSTRLAIKSQGLEPELSQLLLDN